MWGGGRVVLAVKFPSKCQDFLGTRFLSYLFFSRHEGGWLGVLNVLSVTYRPFVENNAMVHKHLQWGKGLMQITKFTKRF